MENLGEIMKSCENCNYYTEHYTGCSECVTWGKYINWKPVEIFKPLHMVELEALTYKNQAKAREDLLKFCEKQH